MGRDHQQVKHWCKVCGKSFPCGRSLGGHMRSHLSLSSSSPGVEERPRRSRCFMGLGAGYGLRKNPKKSWRTSELDGESSNKFCQESREEFPSWKSHFGHMKFHSERFYCNLEEAEGAEAEQELEGPVGFLESQSDNDMKVMMPKRRRSRRVALVSGLPLSDPDYDEEQVDVALSLMMLSTDAGFFGSTNSELESFEKNSVVSLDIGMDAQQERKKNVPRNENQKNVPKKMESADSGKPYVMDESFMKPEANVFSINATEQMDERSKRFSLNKKAVNFSGVDKHASSNKRNAELRSSYLSTTFADHASSDGLSKSPNSKYQCTKCNKSFRSYQALGGHRTSHKRMKACFRSRTYGDNDIVETDSYAEWKPVAKIVNKNIAVASSCGLIKKVKDYECSICCKVFLSGQALGGHKRSHQVASSDYGSHAACHQTIVIEQPPAVTKLLDLNLPNPTDENSSNNSMSVEFKPWWLGGKDKQDLLVSLISNR